MANKTRYLLNIAEQRYNEYIKNKKEKKDTDECDLYLTDAYRKCINHLENKKCVKCNKKLFWESNYLIEENTFNNFPFTDPIVLCVDCMSVHDSIRFEYQHKNKKKLYEWMDKDKKKFEYYCFNCCQENKVCFYKCDYCTRPIDYFYELQRL